MNTIIESLKALAVGDAALTVATVKIGADLYSIKIVKADADAATTIDNTAKIITVTKKDIPTTSDALKAAIGEINIGGTVAVPAIVAAGTKGATSVKCDVDFTTLTTPATCADVTLVDLAPTPTTPTIEDIFFNLGVYDPPLTVATVKINGVVYSIQYKIAKASADAATTIDNTNKVITVAKAIRDNGLKTDIEAINIGGTVAVPAIVAAGTTGAFPVKCDVDFTRLTTPATCADVTLVDPAPTPTTPTIMDSLIALKDSDAALTVATVKINGTEYSIQYKKAAADSATTIDNTTKVITVTKKDMPADATVLKAAIGEINIGGTVAVPAIVDADTKGATSVKCDVDFTTLTAPASCVDVILVDPAPTPTTHTIMDSLIALKDSDAALTVATVKIATVNAA